MLNNNMLGQPLGSGIILGKPRDLRFTVDTTGSIDPVFTVTTLADADFVWTSPLGAVFTGKAPANANFPVVGEYVLRCTDWTKIASISTTSDLISGDGSKWGFVIAFLTGSFSCYNNSLTGDISTWDLSNLTGSFNCFNNSFTGDISIFVLTNLSSEFACYGNDIDYNSTGGAFSTLTSALNVDCRYNGLNEGQVDNILVDCNASSVADWTGKTIYVSGTNAAPSATGEAAIDALRVKNATVTVTGGY